MMSLHMVFEAVSRVQALLAHQALEGVVIEMVHSNVGDQGPSSLELKGTFGACKEAFAVFGRMGYVHVEDFAHR